MFDRDFLKNFGARGRLSSYFHESSSTYNSTRELDRRVSHTEHEREREKNVHCTTAGLAGTPADVEIRTSVPEKTNRPFLDFLRRAHRSTTNASNN